MHAQVAVVLSEKVDTTISKGVLRMIGTVIGGTLGATYMLVASWPQSCSPQRIQRLSFTAESVHYSWSINWQPCRTSSMAGVIKISFSSCLYTASLVVVLSHLGMIHRSVTCHASAGFLVMLDSRLATNPYALIAIICTVTVVVAPLTLTEYKYAIFLMLITFDSLILCQYR